uniref:Uncharacterized protein n=1 Tax=Piliocolobus tephrosceles TaxID=591936 RepID=A0A8C9LPC9_9PRIM
MKKHIYIQIQKSKHFFYILILLYLIDSTNYEEAITLSKIIVNRINKLNRRSLDYLNAKVYFYYSWIGVESTLDIIGITSKAIYDGVIEATINYENLFMEYKSNSDAYITDEPMKTFHKRIAFCLQLYSDAVKAMQYPDENEKKENEEAKERKLRQQEELAQAEEVMSDTSFI